MYGKPKQWSSFLFLATLLAFFLIPSQALAQRDLLSHPGARGQLAIDSLMGFRIGALNGLQYAGPLGFATQSYTEDDPNPGSLNSQTTRMTTFWFAPAADYFVIDRLSIGGLIEIASTSGSVKFKNVNASTTTETTVDLPSRTAFTFLPRVGYMIPLGNRWAVWPRGGIGYASRQTSSATLNTSSKETFSSVILAADVPFLFRVNETFFLSAAPEFVVSLTGERSTNALGREVSADASFFQFGLVTGLGVLLDL